MSDIAILNGLSTYLIDKIPEDWTEDNCKGMPDGRPDPVSGDIFCSIHMGTSQGRIEHTDRSFEEVWGVDITITKRIKAIPQDRINTKVYLTHLTGLAPKMTRVKFAITNRWSAVQAINAAFPSDPVLDRFLDSIQAITPLQAMTRRPTVEFRNEEWFHGTHSGVGPTPRDGWVGISLTQTFGNMIIRADQAADDCDDSSSSGS